VTRLPALALLLLCLLPAPAWAHLVSTRFGELYSGMLHPLTTLQHLVPWVALGLLGGLQAPGAGRWALLAFPVAVVTGTALAEAVPALPFLSLVNALSFVVLGLLVALAIELGTAAFIGVVVLFGLSHGFANAAPEIKDFQYALYAAGVGLTAYILVALSAGSANAIAAGPRWGSVAVRAAGSWIAAAGIMYLGFLLVAA
jgi:hydrogenase/urease accessory protein HupE